MAALSIRDLDERVRDRLRVRAARNGRSMEAEIRAILSEAVIDAPPAGIGLALMDRFSGLGGVELELDGRHEPPRAAPFSA